MANMSYCRFENTYRDLLDCLNNMNNKLSEREAGYKERLVDVCREIIDEYELNKMSEMDDDDEDEDSNTQDEYDGESWDMQSK